MRRGAFSAIVLSSLVLPTLTGCGSLPRQPYLADRPQVLVGETEPEGALADEPEGAGRHRIDGSVAYSYLAMSDGGSDAALGASLRAITSKVR